MTAPDTLVEARPLRDRRRPRTWWLLASGMLLLQIVWIFAVPPFRGSDEFDHAYRAAAVARGQWVAPATDATRGTGAWVTVPEDLVRAAEPQCADLPYTTDADCIGRARDGHYEVATGAGRYTPVFYAAVGLPALPFDGNASLYVMRFAASLIATAFFLLVVWATRLWARTVWPVVGLAVGCTPVVVYSTVLPAPNGLEILAGAGLWTACLGLALTDGRHDRKLLVTLALSGALLASLRSLGPLWCLLIVGSVLVVAPISVALVRRVVVTSKGWWAALVVLAATLANVAWTSTQGSLNVGYREGDEPISTTETITVTLQQMIVWVLQSIAAFPLRNESTHTAVYVAFLILGGWLLWIGLRRGDRRGRIGIVFTAAMSLIAPGVITALTLERYGTVWQGRYAMPYAIGTMLVIGYVLDRNPPKLRHDVVIGTGILFVMGQVVGPIVIAVHERDVSPGVANGAWVMVPVVVLVVLGVLGAAALWAGAFLDDSPDPGSDPGSDPSPDPGRTLQPSP